jgi:hypothetical protein
LGWPNKTIDIIVIFLQFCLYWLVYRGRCHLGKSTDNFRILKRLATIFVKDVFPSTSVIEPTSSLQIHPKTLDTRRRHYDIHTVLSIVCSLVNTTFQITILFHCSCNVKCSLFRHHRTRFFLFSTKSSVFSQQFSCESHNLLNLLWIDHLQIGTGTDWLNSSIKSRKLLLRSCFTGLVNVRSPCYLVDLGRPLHGLFSIFSHGSNLFKDLDTADRLNPMIFQISVFLNPSWCRRNTCRF